MSNTLKLTTAASFQDYYREYSRDFFERTFFGFKSAELFNTLEGVKDEMVLPELVIGENLAKRWSSTFSADTDKAEHTQRKLKTVLNKIEWQFCPTEFENANYLAMLRKKNIQDPADFPEEAYILGRLIQKLKQEFEVAVHQAIAAVSPASTDILKETFDGFLEIIIDTITAGLAPVTTGTITQSNIIGKLRDMWDVVDEAEKDEGRMGIFLNYAQYEMFARAMWDTYHSSPTVQNIANTNYTGYKYELGGENVMLIPIHGMTGKNRIIMTPPENFVIGLDAAENIDLNVEQNHWNLDFYGAFRMGVQIRNVDAGLLVVNDQV